jgi:hypothetical protein
MNILIPSTFAYSSTNQLTMAYLGRNMLLIDNKASVCVTVTPPFLFVSTTNRMQQYKTIYTVKPRFTNLIRS